MTLRHLILAMLEEAPYTGKDIYDNISTHIQHFWSTDHTQVYRALQNMQNKGWLRHDTEQSPNNRSKVYQITPEGRVELLRWLQEPFIEDDMRLSWLAQIHYSYHLTPTERHNLLNRRLAQQRRHLRELEAKAVELEKIINHELTLKHEMALRTLIFAIETVKTNVRWLEQVLDMPERTLMTSADGERP